MVAKPNVTHGKEIAQGHMNYGKAQWPPCTCGIFGNISQRQAHSAWASNQQAVKAKGPWMAAQDVELAAAAWLGLAPN